MSEARTSNRDTSGPTREELLSALFAQMVIQQANIAMMLMGKVPHPHTGETVLDLDGARMLIDQLEMLQAKTEGNLNPDEERLLKQSLLSTQMMFVDAIEAAPKASEPSTPSESEPPISAPANEIAGAEAAGAPAAEEAEAEAKKKFTKKY